jgi:hypothetical protein
MAVLFYAVLLKRWEKHPLLLFMTGMLGFLCTIVGIGCEAYAASHYKMRRPDLVPVVPDCYADVCLFEGQVLHLWGLVGVHLVQV